MRVSAPLDAVSRADAPALSQISPLRYNIRALATASERSGALLGAYTLTGTFLAVDPCNERLIPVDGLLKRAE